MNKKNLRKGFTTVELVIVIAVIAILATALIPTFGGLINSANNTKYMSEAKETYNDYMLAKTAEASSETYYIKADSADVYFKVNAGKLETSAPTTDDVTKCTAKVLVVGTDNGTTTYTLTAGTVHGTTEDVNGVTTCKDCKKPTT